MVTRCNAEGTGSRMMTSAFQGRLGRSLPTRFVASLDINARTKKLKEAL